MGATNQNTNVGLHIIGNIVGIFYPGVGVAINILADVIFPVTAEAPQLNDLEKTQSSAGLMIPILFGKPKPIAGNIIWRAPVELKNRTIQEAPFNIGPDANALTRYQTFAIGLCEGPVLGISRIWANNKIVYDVSETATEEALIASAKFAEVMTFYQGTADQEPDPSMEAIEGVGNVTAHRGLVYVVFNELPLFDYYEQIPNLTFEIVQSGNNTTVDTLERKTDVLFPWEETLDPRACENDHEYRYKSYPIRTTLDAAFDDARADGVLEARLEYLLGYSVDGTTIVPAGGPVADEEEWLYLHYNSPEFLGGEYKDTVSGSGLTLCQIFYSSGFTPGQYFWWNGEPHSSSWPPGFYVIHEYTGAPVFSSETFSSDCGVGAPTYPEEFYGPLWYDEIYLSAEARLAAKIDEINGLFPDNQPVLFTDTYVVDDDATPGGNFHYHICYEPNGLGGSCGTYAGDISQASDYPTTGYSPDTVIKVRRKIRAPDNPCQPRCLPAYPLLPESSDYCTIGGVITRNEDYTLNTGAAGSYKVLQKYTVVGGSVTKYPVGPAILTTDPDNTQAFWEAENALAEAEGTVAPGRVYGVDYPVSDDHNYTREWSSDRIIPNPLYVYQVVGPVLGRVGFLEDERDVSQLTEVLDGYVLSSVATARDNITPMLAYSMADGIDDGPLINFIPHDSPPSFALTVADLGAAEVGKKSPVHTTERTPEEELPRTVVVQFNEPGLNTISQSAPYTRQNSTSEQVVIVKLPITGHPDRMSKLAEMYCNELATARQDHNFSVDASHIETIRPGRNGTIDLGYMTLAVRLTDRTYAHPGLISARGVRHNSDDYVSDATGVAAIATNNELLLSGPTTLEIIDSTALNSEADDAGVYLAPSSVFGGWKSATIIRSYDDGETWEIVATANKQATVGTLLTAIPSGPDNRWDTASEFTVELDYGTLVSSTDEAVLNGANMAFVGSATKGWMVIQWVNADLADGVYTLSRLLQGRKGTEHLVGLIEAGDRFILINDAIRRVSAEPDSIGRTAIYKAVTNSQAEEDTLAVEFTGAGEALEPYSPDHVEWALNDDGDTVITWHRRTRLSGEWRDYVDVPLNEETEAYVVTLMDGSTVLDTIDTSVQTVTLTSDQKDALDGASEPRVAIQQVSATVGAGYPTYSDMPIPV